MKILQIISKLLLDIKKVHPPTHESSENTVIISSKIRPCDQMAQNKPRYKLCIFFNKIIPQKNLHKIHADLKFQSGKVSALFDTFKHIIFSV